MRAGFIGPTPVLLAKPHTYMNLSGESVSFSAFNIERLQLLFKGMMISCTSKFRRQVAVHEAWVCPHICLAYV